MRLFAATFLLVLSAMAGLGQAGPTFQFRFTEPAGPNPVGVRVVEHNDSSRIFEGARPRPLQILMWYPAQSGPKQMTLGDYTEYAQTETSFGKPSTTGKTQEHIAQFTQGLESLPMQAFHDAPLKAGHYPVVVYAPSYNETNTENVELCEYLASYGYIVMASPSLGAAARDMTVDSAGAEAQAKDIHFVTDTASSLPETDMSRIAVIGYSWGGTSALVAAARDRRIDALVALDGSFLYGPVPTNDVHADRFVIPLLAFSRGEEPLTYRDNMQENKNQPGVSTILGEWKQGDLLHLEMLAMSHLSFSSLYQRSAKFRSEGLHFSPGDYSLEEGAEGYHWVALYTREFLDAYLRHDSAAMAFLKRSPIQNGAVKHEILADFRASIPSKQ